MDVDALTWALSVAAAAAVVLPYALSFRRRRRKDRARLEEAVRLGTTRPAAQYPFVDPMRCIGCGSCVAACPEIDVLAVVGGTARVVNGLRCIGHGRCATACPVGAIEIGLGDLRSRDDMPLLDQWGQSLTVPRLFIAGELGGLALVRNAVEQATQAVARIAQLAPAARGESEDGVLDLVVVGAGPAGLTAAAAARQHGLSHLVLEQERDLGGTVYHYPRRKLVLVQAVEIPMMGRLREAEYAKEDLLHVLQGLVRSAALDIRFGERVSAVERHDALFSIVSPRGMTRARFVVLALGRRGTPRKLGVAGEELPKVLYKLVDAESFREKRLLIVGGGDSAVEAAIGLARQPGNEVTLSYRRERLVRIKRKNEQRLGQLLEAGRVCGLFGSEVEEITPATVRLRTAAGRRELRNDFVFVFAGGDPPFELLRGAGVQFGGSVAATPAREPVRPERRP